MPPIDKTIFSLHFQENDQLQPPREKLKAFLESPKKEGLRDLRGSDLEKYSELIKCVQALECNHLQDSKNRPSGETMLYGALSHSQFAKLTLQSTVEHYKYYVHELHALDFKKPTAFIASAEEEMSRLDPKIKNEAAKFFRLQDMVSERKKLLSTLSKRWAALDAELIHIARYVRNNLLKVSKVCKISIDILTDSASRAAIEESVIKEITTYITDHHKGASQHGTISKHDRERVKRDIAMLSRETASILQEDLSALSKLYRAIRDHVIKFIHEIDSILEEIESKKNRTLEEDRAVFTRMEQAVVSLISDYHFDTPKTAIRTKTDYEQLLKEKQDEMVDQIFDLVQRERRRKADRRSAEDQRKSNDPNFKGSNKRTGKDRRTMQTRRQSN